MLEVDCETAAALWANGADWPALATRAVAAALRGAGFAAVVDAASAGLQVSVRLTDDAEVRRLNARYRGQDKPTNILSFPMLDDAAAELAEAAAGPEILLGDLVLAGETTRREAEAQGLALADHATHLLVHGTLHLLGHDHLDDASADAMEALEIGILAGLGIGNPYLVRDAAAGAAR